MFNNREFITEAFTEIMQQLNLRNFEMANIHKIAPGTVRKSVLKTVVYETQFF